MQSAQERIQNLLNRLVSDGTERGLQVAAYLNGELVIDAVAGIADAETGQPVEPGTLFPVFSTTKGVVATLIHILAERGALGYDQRIAEVWPEFAVNGKERVTIRQALDHTAGIPQVPPELREVGLADWTVCCAAVANLTPLWEPGTRQEYHAITYGWILGEIAQRVSGRAFPQLLQEEICQPLGITEMFVGLPPDLEPRVATLEEPGAIAAPMPLPEDARPQAVPGWLGPLHAVMNRSDARRGCMPATNGIMSARAVGRHYAALLPGGVEGVSLLPEDRLAEAITRSLPEKLEEEAPIMNRGLGYALWDAVPGECGARFGHAGYGGSTGFAEPETRLAVGFTKNLYNGGETTEKVLRAVRAALGLHS